MVLDCHWHEERVFDCAEGKGAFQIETSSYELHEVRQFLLTAVKYMEAQLDSSPCSYCAIVFNQPLCSNSFDGVQSNTLTHCFRSILINEAFRKKRMGNGSYILPQNSLYCDTKPYIRVIHKGIVLPFIFHYVFKW